MKFCGQVRCDKDERLDFGEDPDPDPAPRFFKSDYSPLRDGAKNDIARYLKLWTDSDETWWTGWV